MAKQIRVGSSVRWNWGNGTGRGKVIEIHHDSVTQRLQGADITRHGTQDNPAYLIEQDDGDRVLKLGSELERDDG